MAGIKNDDHFMHGEQPGSLPSMVQAGAASGVARHAVGEQLCTARASGSLVIIVSATNDCDPPDGNKSAHPTRHFLRETPAAAPGLWGQPTCSAARPFVSRQATGLSGRPRFTPSLFSSAQFSTQREPLFSLARDGPEFPSLLGGRTRRRCRSLRLVFDEGASKVGGSGSICSQTVITVF